MAYKQAIINGQNSIKEAKLDLDSPAAQQVKKANEFMLQQHKRDLEAKKKGTPKSKRPLTAKKVFKVDPKEFKRIAKKGMDFAWYAYN